MTVSASTNAASSTIGPREVFTSNAVGFISASSAAPTIPVERSLSFMWMVSTSDEANSSSLVTWDAPASAAASGVRFWLQAMTVMPKASPMRATRDPMRPRPRMPRVRPASSRPTDVCQPPSRTDRLSATRLRAPARIRAQVSSTVEATVPPVVPTWMPCSSAAAMSMEALNGPVEAIIRSFGRRSMMLRGSGVRSRITKTTSKGARRSTSRSGSDSWSLKTVMSARSATADQSAMSSATF